MYCRLVSANNKQHWEDTATNVLNESIEFGYADPIYLESELDFFNLRERATFIKIVEQLHSQR